MSWRKEMFGSEKPIIAILHCVRSRAILCIKGPTQ